MKAIVPTSCALAETTFQIVDVPTPEPGAHDLLVEVEAVSVNPIDYKVRSSLPFAGEPKHLRILGWDAVGKVIGKGRQAHRFQVGDEVWYAGDLTRAGSNARMQVVHEDLAAKKPASWSLAQAAAMPLTTLTAWEALFHQLEVKQGRLLMIGGAGGVGSIAIQLAKRAGLEVIATASRKESIEWCHRLGAHHVVDHRNLVEAMKKQGLASVDYIFCASNTADYWEAMAELIKPFGRMCTIVRAGKPLDLDLFCSKSAHICWEVMFTRSLFQAPDMAEQGRILEEAARLADAGQMASTVTQVLHGFLPENFYKAHSLLEQGSMIGKLVIEY